MKKVLAVFMAVLMIFTSISVVAFAADEEERSTVSIDVSEKAPEEKTTRNIVSDKGLVVPINFQQLKMSVIFKIFEKLIKFILGLFAGDNAGDVDNSIASEIGSLGEEISNALEEGSQFIGNNSDQ